MCNPLALVAVAATVGGGLYSANAQQQQGAAMNNYYQTLAQQRQAEGDYAVGQADRQEKLIQDQTQQEGKQLKTSQTEFNASTRAQLAASGVQGQTTNDIQNSNFTKQQLDEALLHYNADLKSYNVRESGRLNKYEADTQSNDYLYQGRVAKQNAKTNAISTLLGTASSVASFGATSGFGGGTRTTFTSSGGASNVSPYRSPNLNLLR